MTRLGRTVALCAMGLLPFTRAAAQSQPPADTVAEWLQKPTSEQMESYYPNAAAIEAASGSAKISCTATVDTTLRNCSVVSESQAGLGFGDAAISMATLFRMKPATRAGMPVDSRVSIPITFMVPPSMITDPDWRRKPTDDELMGSWPVAALKASKSGSASLRCKVTVDGLVNKCVVIAETPKDLGFGSAALSMASLFRMKPLVRDGVPEGGGEVIIPITYDCRGGCDLPANIRTVTLYRNVDWLQAPTSVQVAEAYPVKARKDQMQSGLISLRCSFDGGGLLVKCHTLAENPAREGLATAALTLSHDFKAPLKDSQGNAMRDAQVMLTFAFASRMLDDPASARGKPVVVETLVGPEIAAVFPEKAKAAHIGFGEVTATCVVGDGGLMTECKIQNETPVGMDFAQAAQNILDHTRASLWSEEGLPTFGATMTLRIPMGDEKSRGG